jgi:hypothetical protein
MFPEARSAVALVTCLSIRPLRFRAAPPGSAEFSALFAGLTCRQISTPAGGFCCNQREAFKE